MSAFETTKEIPNLKLARKNFANWNKALLSKDALSVAEFYSDSATFLPTMSPDFKQGSKKAGDYFEHFLEKDPTGEIVEDEIQVLTPDCYLHSGLYNFIVGPDSKREIVEARFSFVWKIDKDGDWKIIHHHSSVKPK